MSRVDTPMFEAFCAGQEKIAREVAEYEARVLEQARLDAERAQREAENRIYDFSVAETAEQRLHRANMAMDIEWNAKEEALSQAERGGLSEAEFLKLAPERRLAIAHAASEARRLKLRRM